MTKMKFNVMGEPRLWIDHDEITKELSKKAMALLIYLVFAPDQRISREQIMTLLWGESDEKAARYNLRHNLWKIRRIMRNNKVEDNWLHADNHVVNVSNKDVLEVDAFKLIQLHQKGLESQWHLSESEIQELLKLYKGHFFDLFYLSDCEDFNDWLYFKREEFQLLYIQCLTEAAKVSESRMQLHTAIDLYKELNNFMPYDDHVATKLIKILISIGDHFNALHYYEQHRKRLRVDLNLNPSMELQIYVDSFKNVKNSEQLSTKGHEICLVLEPHPLEEIPYMTLSCIIDKLLMKYSKKDLLTFDVYAWRDLSRINGNIRGFLGIDVDQGDSLTESTERIRIFKAMYNLLNHCHEHYDLVLDFRHLSKLDVYSEAFFSSLFKTDQGNIMKNYL